jgi:hypothetical protein
MLQFPLLSPSIQAPLMAINGIHGRRFFTLPGALSPSLSSSINWTPNPLPLPARACSPFTCLPRSRSVVHQSSRRALLLSCCSPSSPCRADVCLVVVHALHRAVVTPTSLLAVSVQDIGTSPKLHGSSGSSTSCPRCRCSSSSHRRLAKFCVPDPCVVPRCPALLFLDVR